MRYKYKKEFDYYNYAKIGKIEFFEMKLRIDKGYMEDVLSYRVKISLFKSLIYNFVKLNILIIS